jgi:hypothetical protein
MNHTTGEVILRTVDYQDSAKSTMSSNEGHGRVFKDALESHLSRMIQGMDHASYTIPSPVFAGTHLEGHSVTIERYRTHEENNTKGFRYSVDATTDWNGKPMTVLSARSLMSLDDVCIIITPYARSKIRSRSTVQEPTSVLLNEDPVFGSATIPTITEARSYFGIRS